MNPVSTRRVLSDPDEDPIEQEQPEQQAIPEQPVQQEQPIEQEEIAAEEPQTQSRRVLQEPEQTQQDKPKQDFNVLERFGRGVQRSASGEAGAALSNASGLFEKITRQEQEEKEPGFWDSVIEETGTLAGDAPFMAIGKVMGTMLGTPGGPLASVPLGHAVSFALPEFMKELSRQYRDFEDNGGDLTFGEFIKYDQLMNKTLTAGAFGSILGDVQRAVPFLKQIPVIKQLFDTKYIGKVAEGATTIAGEVGASTVIPAAIEGRLPDKHDVARAAVLFTGMRGAQLPGQLYDVIKNSTAPKFKYALADRIQEMDLAYPPLQEFKQGENPVYKNSVELDRNLTAFDSSVIKNMASKIDTLSTREFASADQAGREMYNRLGPLVAVPIPPKSQSTPEPTKPVKRDVPLVQNPLNQAMVSISGNAASTTASLGRDINTQYQQGRAQEKAPLDERFTAQRREMEGIDVVDPDLASQVQDFIDRFEPGAIPGSASATIVQAASRLRDSMIQYDGEGNIAGYTDVPLNTIVQINRSIKQIPNYDVPPEMLDNLQTLTRMTDQAVVGHLGNTNEALAQEYQNLNNDYTHFKNRWDNNDMRIFHDRTENSEAIAKRFSNLDEFTQLEQAIGGNPQGQRVLNMIRRNVWKNQIGREALNAKTEGEFESNVRDLTREKLRNMMEFLTPEQRQVALEAYDRSNQIRSSAIRSSEQFSTSKQIYEKQMKQWEEKETNRKESDKKLREEVQTKQNLLVSLLQEDPAKLVGNMKTIEGIKRIKSATEKISDGKELYDSLARYETENMFSFMNEGYQRTGRVPYTQLKVELGKKEVRAKLRELNGDKFVREMDEIVELTDQLSKNFKEKIVEYRDDPTVFNTFLNIYSVLGLAQGDLLTPLMAYTAKKNLLKLGNKSYNIWSSKKNFDPENIHKVLNAARAVEHGSKKEIMKAGSDLRIPYQSQ